MSQTPQPIDYATPQTVKPLRWWKIALTALIVVIAGAILLPFTTSWSGPNTVTRVVLPSDPWTVTIPVGGSVQLPGGRGTPTISVTGVVNGLPIVTEQYPGGGGGGPMTPGWGGGFSYGGQMDNERLKSFTNNQATLEISLTPLGQLPTMDVSATPPAESAR